MKLSLKDYYQKVKLSILVSFDINVIDKEKRILLGKRKNNPAKGYFFTPGGNVYKGESFEKAIRRISKRELGFEISPKEVHLNGVSSQIYKNNFKDSHFSTHYYTFNFSYRLKKNQKINETIFLKQHSAIKWMKKENLLKDKEVHIYVKNYFKKTHKADKIIFMK